MLGVTSIRLVVIKNAGKFSCCPVQIVIDNPGIVAIGQIHLSTGVREPQLNGSLVLGTPTAQPPLENL